MLDAEREQEARQGGVAAVVDRCDQVVRPLARDLAGLDRVRRAPVTLIGTTLHFQQVVQCQPIQVGDILQVAEFGQRFDMALTQPVDVHCPPRSEVEYRLHPLRRAAQAGRAAPHRCAFLAYHLCTADRASGRHPPRLRTRRTLVRHHLHHFRDDVAGAAHDHGIAIAHIQSRHMVGVVQRGAGDGDAANLHRPHQGPGRDRAGAADAGFDGFQQGGLFLRRELVRDRPARRARDEAQRALAGVVVELVDHAIDVEWQIVARGTDSSVVAQQTLHALHHTCQIADREAPITQPRQRGRMGVCKRLATHLADAIGVETQRSLRSDSRIQLPQRARRAIAWIGQHLAVVQAGMFVPALEIGPRHVDLAAHFQHLRPALSLQMPGDDGDRAQIGGDILAGAAVTTGRALHEHAILVAQADRQAVELRLDREHQIASIQPFLDPTHEITHFLVGINARLWLRIAEGIAQRQHRHRVLHRGKSAGWGRTHFTRRRIAIHRFGMLALQRFEFTHQRVVLRIGDVRRVFFVITPVGVSDAATEFGDAFGSDGLHPESLRPTPEETGRLHHQRVGLPSGGTACWRS